MTTEPTPTVLEIGQIRLTGNIVPHGWYKHLTRHNGKPYLEAIIILGDVIYWYTPREVRDEQTGQLIRLEKRFAADKLQRSYEQLGEMFGFGKDQARNACKFLVKKGLLKLELRTIVVRGVPINNVMFMEPVPEAIRTLNTPIRSKTDRGGLSADEPTPVVTETETLSVGKQTPVRSKTDTYTEITSEISPEISSDPAAEAADEPDSLPDLSDLIDQIPHFSKRDRQTFLRRYTTDHTIQWCCYVLDPGNQIKNPAGYLRRCCLENKDPPPAHYADHEVETLLRRRRAPANLPPLPPDGLPDDEGCPLADPDPLDPALARLWQAALGELELQMTRATFNTWVKPTRLLAWEGEQVTVGAPNGYIQDWLQNRLYTPIQRTLSGIAGKTVDIQFIVNG